VALEDGEVVFRWRDSAHKNKKRLMRLDLNEFLRRFFLHVLPTGFVRIRHFGFFAHRRRAALLPLCFALLGQTVDPPTVTDSTPKDASRPLWLCPQCGGTMAIVERFHCRRGTAPLSSGEKRETMTCSFSFRIPHARGRQPVRTAYSLLDRTGEHPSILQLRLSAASPHRSAPISSSSAADNTIQALRENSWKSTPIEGVAGNLVIQQERLPSETVAKSPSIRLFRAFV